MSALEIGTARWEPTGVQEGVRSMPEVTVVIPCFNQAQFLVDALDSVMSQTLSPVEVVVVDDGSTDGTHEVAARYVGVRCIRQANRGLAAARNVGLEVSRTEYVVFLDADDKLLPDALAHGHRELSRHPDAAFVSGHFRFIDVEGRPQPEWNPARVETDAYLHLLKSNFIGMIATVMYRAEVLRSFGGFRSGPTGAEDYDSYLRITRVRPVCRHERLVAEYRRYGTAMSDNACRMLVGTLRALRAQHAYVRDNPEYEAAYREGEQYWRDSYLSLAADQLQQAWSIPRKRGRVLMDLACMWRFVPAEALVITRQLVDRVTGPPGSTGEGRQPA